MTKTLLTAGIVSLALTSWSQAQDFCSTMLNVTLNNQSSHLMEIALSGQNMGIGDGYVASNSTYQYQIPTMQLADGASYRMTATITNLDGMTFSLPCGNATIRTLNGCPLDGLDAVVTVSGPRGNYLPRCSIVSTH